MNGCGSHSSHQLAMRERLHSLHSRHRQENHEWQQRVEQRQSPTGHEQSWVWSAMRRSEPISDSIFEHAMRFLGQDARVCSGTISNNKPFSLPTQRL